MDRENFLVSVVCSLIGFVLGFLLVDMIRDKATANQTVERFALGPDIGPNTAYMRILKDQGTGKQYLLVQLTSQGGLFQLEVQPITEKP